MTAFFPEYAESASLGEATTSRSGRREEERRRRAGSEGDKRLRRISRAGKQWKKTMGRTVDMEGKWAFAFCFLSSCISKIAILVHCFRFSELIFYLILCLSFLRVADSSVLRQHTYTDSPSSGPDSGQTIGLP